MPSDLCGNKAALLPQGENSPGQALMGEFVCAPTKLYLHNQAECQTDLALLDVVNQAAGNGTGDG